jgi:hypothetical protein
MRVCFQGGGGKKFVCGVSGKCAFCLLSYKIYPVENGVTIYFFKEISHQLQLLYYVTYILLHYSNTLFYEKSSFLVKNPNVFCQKHFFYSGENTHVLLPPKREFSSSQHSYSGNILSPDMFNLTK